MDLIIMAVIKPAAKPTDNEMRSITESMNKLGNVLDIMGGLIF